jgi:CubicO group peptidase (beta-lactamase class C family)
MTVKPKVNHMKRFIIVVSLALILKTSYSQTSFIRDSLETYIEKGMKQWKIPGLSVAVVKDGKVVHLKGYGVTDLTTKQAVDENTLFMIGSNTKLFTATALTMLEQDKKLSLNDKVDKWVPYFKLNDPNANNLVTVRDLLCHRIGFKTFQGDFTYWASNLTRQDVIRKMSMIEAPYSFRTKWGYCNAAFVTAGEVIQAASGKSWENYIRESILKPLKMNNTKMLAEEITSTPNTAKPYTIVDDNLVKLDFAKIDNLAPAGTISSSAKDMVNWLVAQIDSGKFEENQVIPRMAIESTRQPQSIMGVDFRNNQNTHFYLYGLGVMVGDRAGKVTVHHTGGVDGFTSSVIIVPEEKLGIVILTNTDQNSFFVDLSDEILDSYLMLPYSGYSYKSLQRTKKINLEEKKILDSLKTLVLKKYKPTLPLTSYTGEYTNKLYGDISIRLENKKLIVHFSHHPQLKGNLELIKDNTFLCTYSVPTYGIKEIPFHVENAKVMGLTLAVADFVEFTPYEFLKK